MSKASTMSTDPSQLVSAFDWSKSSLVPRRIGQLTMRRLYLRPRHCSHPPGLPNPPGTDNFPGSPLQSGPKSPMPQQGGPPRCVQCEGLRCNTCFHVKEKSGLIPARGIYPILLLFPWLPAFLVPLNTDHSGSPCYSLRYILLCKKHG